MRVKVKVGVSGGLEMMKRYLITILLITLVLTSGLVVGCGQSQKQRAILLYYLDRTGTLEIESLDAISAVMGSYKISQDALAEFGKFPDGSHVSRLLEAVSNEKKVADEALDTVNSTLSFLGKTPPPREVKTLHSLRIRALQTARDGLLKLSHFSRIRYEYSYSVLSRLVPKQEYPPAGSEELTQGLQLMDEFIRMWGEANVEKDNLMELITR